MCSKGRLGYQGEGRDDTESSDRVQVKCNEGWNLAVEMEERGLVQERL